MKRFLALLLILALVLSLAGCAGSKTYDDWDEGALFMCGLLPVMVDGEWGYVNESGKLAIKPQFSFARVFSRNGLAMTGESGDYTCINTKGKTVFRFEAEYVGNFGEGSLAPFYYTFGGQYGYINEKGKVVIQPQFEYAGRFNGFGVAIVKADGQLGLINEKGEFVVEPRYSGINDFDKHGLAVVEQGELQEGVIDCTGKEVVPVGEYVIRSWRFDEYGYCPATPMTDYQNASYNNIPLGFLDTDGGFRYFAGLKAGDDIGEFSSDGYMVKSYADEQTVYDVNGNVVAEIRAMALGSFSLNEPIAFSSSVGDSFKKWGFCDVSGNVLIEPIYSQVSCFNDNGVAWAFIGEYYEDDYSAVCIDTAGTVISGPFDGTDEQNRANSLWLNWFFSDGYSLVVENEQLGILNDSGEYISDLRFEATARGFLT